MDEMPAIIRPGFYPPPRPRAPEPERQLHHDHHLKQTQQDYESVYYDGGYDTYNGIDHLTTNVPTQPKAPHVPLLSKRGAGAIWSQPQYDSPLPQPEYNLINGNYTIDCPVPYRLLRQVPHSTTRADEFNHLRYTAVTCDPSDFVGEQYNLRPTMFNPPRSTEIMIVITMYNEDDVLLARTLRGVLANISDLTSRAESPWGKGCWKNVVICLISDGRAKIDLRSRALLTLLGVYQEGIARQNIEGRDVAAHVYELTTQLRVQIKNGVVKTSSGGAIPCQFLFCLKEKNQKITNSYRWALQAFGQVLNPKICVFFDAGTEPTKTSLYSLWKNFDLNPTCGSVSAVAEVFMGPKSGLRNPILAAQNFEYNLWNVMDRPFDSLFGFRFDMPGTTIAYRFLALQNDKVGRGPLDTFFTDERNQGGFSAKNKALHNERSLSFDLITKRNCHWTLHYEHSASTRVDVPNTASEYVRQRRRWLNGAFFGSIHDITHIHLIFQSSHHISRKLLLFSQCVYQICTHVYSWFSLGNLFLMFRIILELAIRKTFLANIGGPYIDVMSLAYAGILFLTFVFALGHRPGQENFLSFLITMWYIMAVVVIGCFGLLTVNLTRDWMMPHQLGTTVQECEQLVWRVFAPLGSVYGCWSILALTSGSPEFIWSSIVQYLILIPTNINLVNLYAFCNTHDVSWGVKGSDKAELLPTVRLGNSSYGVAEFPSDDPAEALEQLYEKAAQLLKRKEKVINSTNSFTEMEDYLRNARTLIMAPWVLSNGLLVFWALHHLGQSSSLDTLTSFAGYILWCYAILTLIKSTGAIIYFINHRRGDDIKTKEAPKYKSN